VVNEIQSKKIEEKTVFHFAGEKKKIIITIQEEDVRWWITSGSSVPVNQTNTISGLTKGLGKTEDILVLGQESTVQPNLECSFQSSCLI